MLLMATISPGNPEFRFPLPHGFINHPGTIRGEIRAVIETRTGYQLFNRPALRRYDKDISILTLY